ncbi:MAG: hypothetical protein K940chlam1_00110 [Candidatus Anoxychlamydiales bacterium]|nr:hypothetical protein [Candidatus Anoxychlamydiales bacterium]NGX36349.1 hypothetical protein [Candidatus Anoxychlamydiales bacterium]
MEIRGIINYPITKVGFHTLNPFTSKEKATAVASGILAKYFDAASYPNAIMFGAVVYIGLKIYKIVNEPQKPSTEDKESIDIDGLLELTKQKMRESEATSDLEKKREILAELTEISQMLDKEQLRLSQETTASLQRLAEQFDGLQSELAKLKPSL